MDEYFYIVGTRIPVSEIKDFRIIEREYIYRPTYVEAEGSFGNFLRGVRFQFYQMQPYAAIIGDSDRHSFTSQFAAKTLKTNIVKDIYEDVRTTVGDKFNIKAIRSKKYHCINQTGREFMTYLEDIPALVMRSDGKAFDVKENDELYRTLGEPIAPAINIVHALEIKANETYIFYGSGIHLDDLASEFERLREAVDTYQAEKKAALLDKPKFSLNRLIKRQPATPGLPQAEPKKLAELPEPEVEESTEQND